MRLLAANVELTIAKSKLKSVVVLDFVGPENKSTELGRTLAEKFSSALAGSSGQFSVVERGRITENLANKGLVSLQPHSRALILLHGLQVISGQSRLFSEHLG